MTNIERAIEKLGEVTKIRCTRRPRGQDSGRAGMTDKELTREEISQLYIDGGDEIVAMLTIDHLSERSTRTRRELAEWLRLQASRVENAGKNYADDFCAEFLLPAKKEPKP